MIKIKKILLICVIGFTSCISFYQPNLDESDKRKMVVEALINDREGYQVLRLSKTTMLTRPIVEPYLGCKVKLEINDSIDLNFEEYGNGIYQLWLNKEELITGYKYKLSIITPSNLLITSDYQVMPAPSSIDSIYFVLKDIPTDNPYIVWQGIQFKIDVKLGSTLAKYFWWDIEETWEHHAIYPITWHLAGGGLANSFPPDYSRFYCWTTKMIKDIFVLNASGISSETYNGFTLHLVDNQTQRLNFGYSLLVNQYTINESTFEYLKKLRKNSSEQGGPYSTQPLKVRGNLKCVSDPGIEILGFFNVASISQKRIFVRNVKDLKLTDPTCPPPDIPGTKYYYWYQDDSGNLHGIIEPCVLCDWVEGTPEKPNFWPY